MTRTDCNVGINLTEVKFRIFKFNEFIEKRIREACKPVKNELRSIDYNHKKGTVTITWYGDVDLESREYLDFREFRSQLNDRRYFDKIA